MRLSQIASGDYRVVVEGRFGRMAKGFLDPEWKRLTEQDKYFLENLDGYYRDRLNAFRDKGLSLQRALDEIKMLQQRHDTHRGATP